MTDIKIGDYVTVVDDQKTYTTYEDWAISNKLKNWKRGNSCSNGFSGVVTAIAAHGINPSKILISVCGDGHEVIINIDGVKKVENTSGMKPIKRGMKEAVTRDWRKVTQLTWFEGIHIGECVAGVLDGVLQTWYPSGLRHGDYGPICERDIFSPVEYEWQWMVKNQLSGKFHTTDFFKTEESLKNSSNRFNPFEWTIISRIEESKREVK